jgi:hypothetical protein
VCFAFDKIEIISCDAHFTTDIFTGKPGLFMFLSLLLDVILMIFKSIDYVK